MLKKQFKAYFCLYFTQNNNTKLKGLKFVEILFSFNFFYRKILSKNYAKIKSYLEIAIKMRITLLRVTILISIFLNYLMCNAFV